MKEAPTVVTFSARDDAADTEFAGIPADTRYGLRSFPSPDLYRQKVTEIAPRAAYDATNALYALAQRDWHVRGQTGCMFARLAALQADNLRWIYLVTDYVGNDACLALSVRDKIRIALAEESVEVVSLLMPEVATAKEALAVIHGLVHANAFWVENESESDGILNLHVRCPVSPSDGRVDAWVMAFAPFDFMPNTRRGPFFELAIRAKQKPQQIFHRLNQDRNVAHLADVPLQMSDEHWEHRWLSTLRRTRMILGSEPDDLSAAKSTIAIPLPLLRAN